MKIRFNSVDETLNFADKLGHYVKKGMFFSLVGDLASGKTTFTQGLARGLNIHSIVSSPTFNILKIYRSGRIPLFHVDAYRLLGNDYDLGIDEYAEEGLTVVEWPEYYMAMPTNHLEFRFRYLDDTSRELEIIPHGATYENLLKEIEIC